MVLGGRSEQGYPADVDQLDRGVAGKGVEVAHDDVDGSDAMLLQLVEVILFVAASQDAAVDGGMQGLDAAVKHLGKSGELGDLADVEFGFAQLVGGAPAGDE